MSTQSAERDLSFSPDFAERVMSCAEDIRSRRRTWRIGAVAAAVAGIAVSASAFFLVPARQAGPAPRLQMAIASAARIDARATQIDPLQYLLPEASPLAQFAGRYSERMYGRQRQTGELLLADDEAEQGDF